MDVEEQAATAHEARRLHGPKRLLQIGPAVALVAAVASGVLGANGTVGFFLLLLLLAVVFATTGLWIGTALLVDEFRGEPTSLRRGLLTGGMFLAALVCMTAVGGVAATLGGGG